MIVPEREEREYRIQEICEDIMAKNIPKFMETDFRSSTNLKQDLKKKKNHSLNAETKDKEETLKISQRQDTLPSKEQLIVDFAIQTMQAKR